MLIRNTPLLGPYRRTIPKVLWWEGRWVHLALKRGKLRVCLHQPAVCLVPAGSLVGRLVDWLIGWLAGRLVGWLVGWLVGRLVGWFIRWMVCW